MLKVSLITLIFASVAMSQLIIDPAVPWGKVVIDQMVAAINAHETWSKLGVLEFTSIWYTLGKGDKWTVYITVHQKADATKRLTCTVDLLQTFHEPHNRKFSVGLVICQNDPEHTTTAAPL